MKYIVTLIFAIIFSVRGADAQPWATHIDVGSYHCANEDFTWDGPASFCSPISRPGDFCGSYGRCYTIPEYPDYQLGCGKCTTTAQDDRGTTAEIRQPTGEPDSDCQSGQVCPGDNLCSGACVAGAEVRDACATWMFPHFEKGQCHCSDGSDPCPRPSYHCANEDFTWDGPASFCSLNSRPGDSCGVSGLCYYIPEFANFPLGCGKCTATAQDDRRTTAEIRQPTGEPDSDCQWSGQVCPGDNLCSGACVAGAEVRNACATWMFPYFETGQCVCSDGSAPCSRRNVAGITEDDYNLVGNYYCRNTKCLGLECSASSLGDCIEMALADSQCLDNGKYVLFGVGSNDFCGCGYYREDTCDAGVRNPSSRYALYRYSEDSTDSPTDAPGVVSRSYHCANQDFTWDGPASFCSPNSQPGDSCGVSGLCYTIPTHADFALGCGHCTTTDCSSNDDCGKKSFCNFDDTTVGHCETCASILNGCSNDNFITQEGEDACSEVCEQNTVDSCVAVNHIYDNPGYYTCGCVPSDDQCFSDGACVAETDCPDVDGLENNDVIPSCDICDMDTFECSLGLTSSGFNPPFTGAGPLCGDCDEHGLCFCSCQHAYGLHYGYVECPGYSFAQNTHCNCEGDCLSEGNTWCGCEEAQACCNENGKQSIVEYEESSLNIPFLIIGIVGGVLFIAAIAICFWVQKGSEHKDLHQFSGSKQNNGALAAV